MKILYVTTISDTVNSFLIPHIKMLIDQGHQVDVAFNINQEVNKELIELGSKIHVLDFQRIPYNKQNYLAYKKLKALIKIEKYDLVHTHTPVASAIVRIATRKMKDVKVIYTGHGFHFFKGAPLINWLIYFPIEKWLSKYTDVLITINKEDYTIAKKSFKARKIDYVPGIGLDIKDIQEVNIEKKEKRKELGIPNGGFLVLSVGELNKNKNHEAVIHSLATLKDPNIYYVICGLGPLEEYLQNLIMELGLINQVKLIGYRKDIIEIYKASDLFVFPSFREGLSVALMEAMACGLPVVCSNIRGNIDLIEDGKGGYLFNPNNSNEIAEKMVKLYKNLNLMNKMKDYNLLKIQDFEKTIILERMRKIYKYLN